jgi:hypothetical protein
MRGRGGLRHPGRPSAQPRPAAAPLGPASGAGNSLDLAELLGREGARRQARVTETQFDLHDAAAPHARACGQGQAAERELDMRDLQPFRGYRDLAVGGLAGRPDKDAKGLPGA